MSKKHKKESRPKQRGTRGPDRPAHPAAPAVRPGTLEAPHQAASRKAKPEPGSSARSEKTASSSSAGTPAQLVPPLNAAGEPREALRPWAKVRRHVNPVAWPVLDAVRIETPAPPVVEKRHATVDVTVNPLERQRNQQPAPPPDITARSLLVLTLLADEFIAPDANGPLDGVTFLAASQDDSVFVTRLVSSGADGCDTRHY